MKLSFEGPEMSIHLASRASKSLAVRWGRADSAAKAFKSRRVSEKGASHGLQYVRAPDRMAQPRAFVHEHACPARGSRLQEAGRGRSALEGDPGPRRFEEEGEGRGPMEHVHAAELA